MSSTASPSSTTVRPRTAGSAPNRRVHAPFEMTATWAGAPSASSAAVGARPSAIGTPRVSKSPAVTHAPRTRSAPRGSESVIVEPATPASRSNEVSPVCQSRKFEGLGLACVQPLPSRVSQIRTSRSGSWYGRGRRSIPSISAKIDVTAPMPRPSVSTTTAATPGRRATCRSAYPKSCVSPIVLLLVVIARS